MNEQEAPRFLSYSDWNESPEGVARELHSFIDDFRSFTPEWFAEVKFHLLKQSGLTKDTRNDLCRVSIHGGYCDRCESLYKAKNCLLWSHLFSKAKAVVDDRSPPCIRLALRKNSIRTVASFLTSADLIEAPFYRRRRASSCRMMAQWGYCVPDEYCRHIPDNNANPLQYIIARERVKLSRALRPGTGRPRSITP
ncbi:MAG: hypothetical protein C4K49_11060 [Candidatus Thorarchaeota archaeon]|nr:MAG: hypothetical protein C4K49_11060 [Candidatus Thorarchaeota archaeon]